MRSSTGWRFAGARIDGEQPAHQSWASRAHVHSRWPTLPPQRNELFLTLLDRQPGSLPRLTAALMQMRLALERLWDAGASESAAM